SSTNYGGKMSSILKAISGRPYKDLPPHHDHLTASPRLCGTAPSAPLKLQNKPPTMATVSSLIIFWLLISTSSPSLISTGNVSLTTDTEAKKKPSSASVDTPS